MFRQFATAPLLLACLLASSLAFVAESIVEETGVDSPSIVIAVDKHWNGPEADKLKTVSGSHPVVMSWEAMKMGEMMGISIDQIERAAVVSMQGQMVTALRTSKPFDQNKVLKTLVPNATDTRMDQGDSWSSDNVRQVVSLADRRTLVILPPKLPSQLTKKGIGAWSGEQLAALGDAANTKSLLLLRLPPSMVRGLVKPDDSRAEPFRPLVEARSLQMHMEVDRGLRVTFSTAFVDEQAAQNAAPALKKVMEGLNAYFEFSKTKMPEFLRSQKSEYPAAEEVADTWAGAIQAAQAGLQEAKVVQKDKDVSVTIVIKTDHPVTAAVLLLSLAPRPQK
jgi:hypothetical protein